MDISGQLFLNRFGEIVLFSGVEEVKERIRNILLIAEREVPYDIISGDCYSFIPRERYTDYIQETMVGMLENLLVKNLKDSSVSNLKIRFTKDVIDDKKLLMVVSFQYQGTSDDMKITLLSEGF